MNALVPYNPPAEPVYSGAGGVPVMWVADPFRGAVRGMIAPSGVSIAEIVARALLIDPALDAAAFHASGTVLINGQEVPRAYWPRLRVHRRGGRRVMVTLHPGLGKGGGNILAIALQIAAIAVAFALLGPFGAAVQGALGLTSSQASLLVLGTTVGASIAANALSAPPTVPQIGQAASGSIGHAGAQGNVLAPNNPLPRMTGARRFAPPFGCAPYAYLDGDDEVIEALYVYAGPTAHGDGQYDGVSLADMPDIEVQSSEGKPGDPPQTLITRYARTDNVGISVSRHRVSADDGAVLDDQLRPEASLPIFHPVAGARACDEIVLIFESGAGLIYISDPSQAVAFPMRIEFKRANDEDWIKGPEFHFISNKNKPYRKQVVLRWESQPLFAAQAPTTDAPYLAFKSVPGQTINPARAGWQADGYFSAGSGGDLMSAATFNSHHVRNVSLTADGVILHLDPEVFPKDRYQVRVSFGLTYLASQFTPASYLLAGKVYDLFGYYEDGGVYKIATSRANLRDELTLSRCSTVINENPLPKPEGIAYTAVRSRNRSLGVYTELAAGLVPDWDGTEWSGLVATRNPAPHYRARVAAHFPPTLISDDALIDWRQYNVDQGYETSAVLLDGSFMDALNLLASAGRARPRRSPLWDVVVDRDTSAEAPVQTFSMRNVANFSIGAPMVEPTGGFFVRYLDRAQDWRENYVPVSNPYCADPSTPMEEIRNDAQDDEAAVVARALFDLKQYELRANEFSFDVPALGLCSQRGDLIAVQHFRLSPFAGAARIVEIIYNGIGQVTGLVLDGTIPQPADLGFSNIDAAWSNYSAAFSGARIGVAIRLKNGGEQKAEIFPVGTDSKQVTFVTPFAWPEGLDVGCHVVSGPLGEEYRRMKIKSIVPKGRLRYGIVAVDEANEIHSAV